MERPAIASGRVNGLPVEQHFRLVQIRQGIDFIPIIRVEEDRFEEKRAGSTGQPRLEWFPPASAQCSLSGLFQLDPMLFRGSPVAACRNGLRPPDEQ